MKTEKLLVIADDLTGANDTGIMFAESGLSTILKTNLTNLLTTYLDNADVFTVSTDSRALGKRAVEITKQTVAAAIDNKVEQIYLKIDSTMRGSVQYQIEGALAAWSKKYPEAKAVICCAYPDMGRTIENGYLYVNGVPVHESASGKDPICPVLSSDMKELLPDSYILTYINEDDLYKKILSTKQNQIVLNAGTDHDLEVIAKVIHRIGNRIIPVGSAGLAKKLKNNGSKLQYQSEPINLGRTLILVTSIHETSQTQVDEYISSVGGNSIVFNPAPSQLINYDVSNTSLKQQLYALISNCKNNVIIRANPAKINMDISIHEIAKLISKYLAELAKYCLEHKSFDSLILFGGDGAAALLDEIGVTELQLLRSILPGVPLCIIKAGKFQGLKVMTKSGGFGDKKLLINMMKNNL